MSGRELAEQEKAIDQYIVAISSVSNKNEGLIRQLDSVNKYADKIIKEKDKQIAELKEKIKGDLPSKCQKHRKKAKE
jgi:hypothetical protein